jgi:dephospho-CoA kinase
MIILGLTGSIGMGKSTVAAHITSRGIPVCDADAEVHALYRGAGVAPIEAAFPGVVTDGAIDRAKLSAHLLRDPSGFKRLEAIIHPLVREAERNALARFKSEGAGIAVLEIPLLFETGGDQLCDATLLVSAPAEVQRARVLARPGMTEEKFSQILARQWPDAKKRDFATFVVDTGLPLADTLAAVDNVLSSVARLPATAYASHWRTH